MMKQSQVDHLLNLWRTDQTISENIVVWHEEEERLPTYAEFPADISPHLLNAIKRQGIDKPFTHQVTSWSLIKNRKNVVLATGTSSGKTLCYTVPIVNGLLADPETRALLVFPTKALAQDQKNALVNLISNLPEIALSSIGGYDGDTPAAQRALIRKQSRILITNPDMLHLGILPHHTSWVEFFKNLQFIVIDEMHVYRGVFGSHVANLLRRLKRIVNFYGSYPQFIMTSATIANPNELAEKLIEDEVEIVNEDASPHSKRHFLLYNPPIIDDNLGIRRSASAESVRLASDLLTYQIQTILFAQTRRSVELLSMELKNRNPEYSERIQSYRSGYLAQERRQIEKDLRSGESLTVAATNALELGIDIGGMGAIILVGYPGSISATRQEIGRAGRRLEDSIAVLVASSSPLDQYLMRHAEYLIDRTPERALINPDNLLILLHHLRCAVFELPFSGNYSFGNSPKELVSGLLDILTQEGTIHKSSGRYYWISKNYPATEFSIRNTTAELISLVAEENDEARTIGLVDRDSAFWMVHPEAVYLHGGEMYLVNELNLQEKKASLSPVLADFFTIPKKNIELVKINIQQMCQKKGSEVFYGDILVKTTVTGYRRVSWSHENLGDFPLDLPTTELRTTAIWMTISEETIGQLQELDLWNNAANNYGHNWSLQKKLARRRDNFTCQSCSAIEQDVAHHVHHKIPFRNFQNYEQANALENLITLCPTCHKKAEVAVQMRSSLAGLAYALMQLSPLFIMCDVRDLGMYFDPQAPFADQRPTIAIYDQISGGIGLSEEIYRIYSELIMRTLDLVETCGCKDGCPSCVGPAGENGLGGKEHVLELLRILCGK